MAGQFIFHKFAAKEHAMPFIDTHTHLYQPQFKSDIDDVIKRGSDAGVEKCLLPNIDARSVHPMMSLVERYPDHCAPMMGLHPTSVKENYSDELALVEKKLTENNHPFIAVGEIGIDLYWDKTFLKEQQEAFRIQIELAKTLHLPIVIHARDSFDDIFAIMDDLNDEHLHGVFHSFSGTIEQAQKALDYGFYLGIGGIVTFKNAGLDKVVKDLPLERMLLETDSPYLAPAPYRGKRNESAYVRLIAEKISSVKNVELAQVSSITTKNAKTLFTRINE
jgi:TatD DNase family protein